ncbi:MAG TPA: cytosine permease [Chthoniobacterales bacterium]|jgi:cytosine/uracil/thiamine/allantoin permease|nr:cytosine permease [Chthoniobacterales bacterium]
MTPLPAPAAASQIPKLESDALINDDLAPVPLTERTWSMWSIAALWVGMAICITTYTLASSLIEQGMSWKQAILTIFLGNLIVLIPMTSSPSRSPPSRPTSRPTSSRPRMISRISRPA